MGTGLGTAPVGPGVDNRIMRTALAAVVTVLAALGAPPAHADPTPTPSVPYQVPGLSLNDAMKIAATGGGLCRWWF